MNDQTKKIDEKLVQVEKQIKSSIDEMNEKSEAKAKEDAEKIHSFEKKLRGLHKRVKQDQEESSGKLRADLGLLQSDYKVTSEKIVQLERFMDRIRASNTYGEPIVNFNEDSVTKKELKQTVEASIKPFVKSLKGLQRSNSEAEPVIDDIREDVIMIKDILKK